MCVYTGLLIAFEQKKERKRRRLDRMKLTILALLAAVFGAGSLKYLRDEHKKLTFAAYATTIGTSLLVGTVTMLLLCHFEVSAYLQGALVIISAYSAEELLNVASPLLIRAICKKLDIEPPELKRRREDREGDSGDAKSCTEE